MNCAEAKGHLIAVSKPQVSYRINHRRLVPRASERRSKMIAFGYYGGKFAHLDFILPLLPTHFDHFCEPFGGSAAVLINRPPAPLETYNDLDSEVANFFECLRDRGDELASSTPSLSTVAKKWSPTAFFSSSLDGVMGMSVNAGQVWMSHRTRLNFAAASNCRSAPSLTKHKSTSLSRRASPRAWEPKRIARRNGRARSIASRHRASVSRCGCNEGGKFSSSNFTRRNVAPAVCFGKPALATSGFSRRAYPCSIRGSRTFSTQSWANARPRKPSQSR